MKDMDAQIQDWYKGLHMQRLDLVGDYAGNELFLLDGDSHLLQCFGDPKIKLKGKLCRNFEVFLRLHWLTDAYQDFQLLHVVYIVERFLESLVRRLCNFHLISFHRSSPKRPIVVQL